VFVLFLADSLPFAHVAPCFFAQLEHEELQKKSKKFEKEIHLNKMTRAGQMKRARCVNNGSSRSLHFLFTVATCHGSGRNAEKELEIVKQEKDTIDRNRCVYPICNYIALFRSSVVIYLSTCMRRWHAAMLCVPGLMWMGS
jgi:hypothetical protein